MAHYLAVSTDGTGFFGRPEPTVGVRVVFDPELMFAAREKLQGRAVARALNGDEGLVVHEDPTDALKWPCRLWRVSELERPVKLQPRNRWARCLALTVVDEAPSWLIFGEHGAAVERVLRQAQTLTQANADAVAAELDRCASPPVDWSAHEVGPSIRQPLGIAPTQLLHVVDAAARATAPDVFEFDPIDEVDYIADPAWQKARSAAGAAMLAHGLPDAVHPPELDSYAAAWTEVIGQPPAEV